MIGLLGPKDANEEESVDLEGVAVGGDAVGKGTRIGIEGGSPPRERIDVGEENAEIGAKALDEIELAGRGEGKEIPDERVDAVEDVLVLDAEELFVGEIEDDTFCEEGDEMKGIRVWRSWKMEGI